MYKKKKILSVIIARGGSKGLKNKNLIKLGKHPLVAWPILAAKKSKLLDNVIISTDSKKIIKAVKKYNITVPFVRPKNISTGNASSREVIMHAINYYKKRKIIYDYVILLEPTSPLTSHHDIDKSIKFLINRSKNADALVSVSKCESQHPVFQYEKNKKNILKKKFFKNIKYLNRQNLSKVYYLDGSLYISKVDSFIKLKDFMGPKTLGIEMPKRQSFEIDDKLDFLIFKNLIKL